MDTIKCRAAYTPNPLQGRVAKRDMMPIEQVYSGGGSEEGEEVTSTGELPHTLPGTAARHHRRRSSAYVTHLDPSNFINFTKEGFISGNYEDEALKCANETILEAGEDEDEDEDEDGQVSLG